MLIVNIYSFDGNDLKLMLVGSTNLLAEKKAEIDSLNVFPVPDGQVGCTVSNYTYNGHQRSSFPCI